jgi:Helix-turn-helix domain
VTIETEESVVVRATKAQQTSLLWCPSCRRQVEMVTPEQAAQIAGVSSRTIYRCVEAGKFHFSQAQDASLLICRSSLWAWKSAQARLGLEGR